MSHRESLPMRILIFIDVYGFFVNIIKSGNFIVFAGKINEPNLHAKTLGYINWVDWRLCHAKLFKQLQCGVLRFFEICFSV